MTHKEQTRLRVLNSVLERRMSVEQAAEVLGLSIRHTWRVLAAYRREGAAALVHGNRGRPPANTRAAALAHEVVTLARERYAGVNHTHLAELLAEREGLHLSRSTVRRILTGAGIPSPRHRRPPRHRCRRERMPQEGALLQLDGSHHAWLEERGPRLCLLLAVDDATGTVPYALFREQEDARGYFRLLRGIIQGHGVPLAVYSDRHAVFYVAPPERVVDEEGDRTQRSLTQVGRALTELGVQPIFARSPQAKGRVERCAGTFQGRLVSELRLAGATSLEEANQVLWGYLPKFNRRFGVPPAERDLAYRPVPAGVDLDGVLAFRYRRKVARDNTVRFERRVVQVLPDGSRPTFAHAWVEVQQRLDGDLVVTQHGTRLRTRLVPPPSAWDRGPNGHRPEPSVRPRRLEEAASPGGAPGPWGAVGGCGTESAADSSVVHHPDGGNLSLLQPRETPRRTRRRARRRPLQPTPRQQARWEAVQAAKAPGLSISAIAREVGIERKTARKYVAAASPPINRRPLDADPEAVTDKIPEP